MVASSTRVIQRQRNIHHKDGTGLQHAENTVQRYLAVASLEFATPFAIRHWRETHNVKVILSTDATFSLELLPEFEPISPPESWSNTIANVIATVLSYSSANGLCLKRRAHGTRATAFKRTVTQKVLNAAKNSKATLHHFDAANRFIKSSAAVPRDSSLSTIKERAEYCALGLTEALQGLPISGLRLRSATREPQNLVITSMGHGKPIAIVPSISAPNLLVSLEAIRLTLNSAAERKAIECAFLRNLTYNHFVGKPPCPATPSNHKKVLTRRNGVMSLATCSTDADISPGAAQASGDGTPLSPMFPDNAFASTDPAEATNISDIQKLPVIERFSEIVRPQKGCLSEVAAVGEPRNALQLAEAEKNVDSSSLVIDQVLRPDGPTAARRPPRPPPKLPPPDNAAASCPPSRGTNPTTGAEKIKSLLTQNAAAAKCGFAALALVNRRETQAYEATVRRATSVRSSCAGAREKQRCESDCGRSAAHAARNGLYNIINAPGRAVIAFSQELSDLSPVDPGSSYCDSTLGGSSIDVLITKFQTKAFLTAVCDEAGIIDVD